MKELFIIIFLILLIGITQAGPLLLVDSFNARSYSIAQADVSTTADIDSILVNPAGLAGLKSVSASIFYLPWFEDMNIFSLSAGYPLLIKGQFYGTAGLSFASFSVPPFPNYASEEEGGERLPQDLDANDIMVNLGYGYPLLKNIDIGINMKYVKTKLGYTESTSGALAFDIGLLSKMTVPCISSKNPDNNLSMGLALQNLGVPQKYISKPSSLDYKIRVGAGYLFYTQEKADSSFLLEFNKTMNQDIKVSSAIEMGLINMFKIRIGYKAAGNSAIGFTAGGGIHYYLSGYYIYFDYSIIPLGDLGTHHAFSLKVKFSDMEKRMKINKLITEMKNYYKNNNYDTELENVNAILSENPSNEKALKYRQKLSNQYKEMAVKNKKERHFKQSIEYWKRYQILNPQDDSVASEISALEKIINDNEMPQVSLESFNKEDTIIVNQQEFTLSGQATDNTELKEVRINNKTVPVLEKSQTTIKLVIPLQEGENSIEIYIEDLKGNKLEKTLKIIYKPGEISPESEETIELDKSKETNQ